MIELFSYIVLISVVSVPCRGQLGSISGPLPPLQMYYQPVLSQTNQATTQQFYNQAPSYPHPVSSVYTFPGPNPMMFYGHVIHYQPVAQIQKKSSAISELYTSLPEPQTTSSESAASFDSGSVRRDSPQFDTPTVQSTLRSEDIDMDSYPIPVNLVPNSQEGSIYPLQLVIPILPTFNTGMDHRVPGLILPVQFYNFNQVTSIPIESVSPVPITDSPIHDLTKLTAPVPEQEYSVTKEPLAGQVLETEYSATELPTTIPTLVTEGEEYVPEQFTESVGKGDSTTEALTEVPPTVIKTEDLISELPLPVPSMVPSVDEAALTTAIPESYAGLDYSSLKTYFSALYSYENTYASSYSSYIPVTKFEQNRSADGYQLKFETGNGIKSEEEGHLKKISLSNDNRIDNDSRRGFDHQGPSTAGVAHVKSGQVIWTSPECITFTLRYVADENGYRPEITDLLDTNCLFYGNTNNDISGSLPSPLNF